LKDFYYIDIEEKLILEGIVDRFTDKITGALLITPNRVTTARGILVIPGVWLIFTPFHFHLWLAELIIAIALWMDALDGAIARKRNLSTKFGKYYDPAMDKVKELMILSAFIFYWDLWSITDPGLFLISAFWYLIAEAALFGISLYKHSISGGHPTKYIAPEIEGANSYGKIKTFVSFAGILIIIPLLETEISPDFFAPIFIIAFVMAILSGWKHLSVIQTKPA